jgi:hypothetical protein
MNIMKVVSKLNVAGRTLLTLNEDVLELNASKVIVDGKEYDYDIAYDLPNTIGVKVSDVVSDVVEFI